MEAKGGSGRFAPTFNLQLHGRLVFAQRVLGHAHVPARVRRAHLADDQLGLDRRVRVHFLDVVPVRQEHFVRDKRLHNGHRRYPGIRNVSGLVRTNGNMGTWADRRAWSICLTFFLKKICK